MTGNYIVDQNNKIYKRALKREIEVWQNAAKSYKLEVEKELDSTIIGEDNPILIRYDNYKIGIDSTSEWAWIDFLTTKFKCVDKGISLGSGSGRVEKRFIERGFVKSFDTIDIISQINPLNDYSKDNIHSIKDLNFIHLPENKYDLILCNGILHHIMNLEHLLFQVNKALTNEGILVVREYVGESNCQWSNEKIKILNAKLNKKFGQKYPFLKITRLPVWNTSPFETIRSSEIPHIIKKYFGNSTEFEITWGAAYHTILTNLSHIARYKKRDLKNKARVINEILEYAVELDKELTNYKPIINPCSLFGVYRKSDIGTPIPARAWTTKELKYQLNLHLPFYRRLRRRLRGFEVLRKAFRFFKKST